MGTGESTFDVGAYRVRKTDAHTLELNQPRPSIVLAIPDLHAPFHHPDALKFLADLKETFKPDVVVCLGDEIDHAALSFHDKDPHMPSASDEYQNALGFLGDLYKLFPNVLCCTSNHTSRPFRLAHKAGLPSHYLKSYREFLHAPEGWIWADRILIDNVVYEHGDPGTGRNAAYQASMENGMSTVIGHVHGWAGVTYSANPFRQKFFMNAGCLIDTQSLAFRYGAKYRNKATLGAGIIQYGKSANFVRMEESDYR